MTLTKFVEASEDHECAPTEE